MFSFVLPAELVAGTRSALDEIRTWWFALAFVCIGLETRFVELATDGSGAAGARLPRRAGASTCSGRCCWPGCCSAARGRRKRLFELQSGDRSR